MMSENLCLDFAHKNKPIFKVHCLSGTESTFNATRKHHQAERKIGPNVWEFSWREPGPDGKRKHRRMVIGRVDQLVDESAARGRIAGLHLDINFWDARLKGNPLTIAELAEHYRQRELKPDTVWKTYSTKLTSEGYLSKMDLASLG